ncbi:integrase, catalytic region, zinc finger, CCHC-type containing protein [Tanacetum coccineum]
MTGDRSQLTNFVSKFLGTVKFGNDHVAKIMGYRDYQIRNVTILRVYYVEGLRHNLFSVGQFCDSNLKVAFRQHTCYIRNLEGVDLLNGSRGENLYTLSFGNMMASSPICLLSKASKTKSWLWHRHLSHLNFGAINHLARHEQLMRGFLWCQGEMKKGKAKVAWDSVCMPKHEGGLGIRRIEDFNIALMATHIWSIFTHRESLWVKWVYTYKLKGRSFWDVPCRSDASWGWHKLLQIRSTIRPFIWHKINNALFYYYDAFLTAVEPKTYKDALTQACWIESMQEELNKVRKHLSSAYRKALKCGKRLFRYLKGTVHQGLWYPKDSSIALTAFADADHASCQDTCRSTSGSMQFLSDRLVTSPSKRQKRVAISKWDRHYFVNTEYQLADIFTKALGRNRIEFLINKLEMRSFTPETLKQLADEVDE